MNAAFLLVTSAMLVGQPGEKKVEPVPPPKVVVAPAAGAGCGNDQCCDNGFGHRFRDRLRGLFNRDNCDSCQPSCQSHHTRQPMFRSNDCNDCGRRTWGWQRDGRCHNQCAPQTCHDPCRGGFNLLEKLRGGFHRRDNCCDGGCGGPTNGVIVGPRPGEKIEAPKKMPVDPNKGGKKPQPIQIDDAPTSFAPSAIPSAPPAPTVEVTPIPAPGVQVPLPVPAPRVESDRRDPF